MKKRFISLIIFAMFLFIPSVKAGVNISITPSSITAIEGNSVTLTVTVSSSEPFAGLEYNIDYDSSILSLTSSSAPGGGTHLADTTPNNETYKMSYTYTFKTRRSGTATVSVTNEKVITSDLRELKIAKSTARVNVMTQAELQASYSSNNNLSGLGIVDYTLTPAFNRDTTEYSVTLKPETEKINVYAIKEDSTSGVYGAGDVNVSEGLNKIKIQVIAENGNVKIYTINATVQELDPIEIKVGDESLYVIRKKKGLEFNNNLFTETTTNINAVEVPAFYNEKTDTTVVAVKNSDGLVFFYVKDGDNYYPYREIKSDNLAIKYIGTDKVPYSYKKKKVTIGDYEYDAFVKYDNSRFYVIYGINLVTGNKGYYTYDNLENSFQRFDFDDNEKYKSVEEETRKVELILGGCGIALFGILIITFIASAIRGHKFNKLKKEYLQEINELKHYNSSPKEIESNEPVKEDSKKIDDKVNNDKEEDIREERKTENITQVIESLKREENKTKKGSKKGKKNEE